VKLKRYFVPHSRARQLCRLASAALVFSSIAHAQQPDQNTEDIAVPAGVPLHIRVTRTAPLRRGAAVEGLLTEPVYVYDRIILPKDAVVHGVVSDLAPAERKIRIQAILNGDVTPLHDPIVNFNTIHINNLDVALDSKALIRSTQLIRFTPVTKRPSLFRQAETMVRDRIQSTREQLFSPGKKDRALKLFYGQLPYHPQRIWAGTLFIADLDAPAKVTLPSEPRTPTTTVSTSALDHLNVTARLTTTLSSDISKKDDHVSAVVTQPLFDAQHELILPEGSQLEGTIQQSKPSRSFGRNGQLRFAFRSVKRAGEDAEQVHGTLTRAESNSSQNVTVDQEGGVKSNADKNRFVAPLLLGVLAAAGQHHDEDGNGLGSNTVASNGFGLIARVIALTVSDSNVATGFGAYAFAKSIYFRFLIRGHPVAFPQDTLVEVQLSAR
jgi:hypothetical protein